MTPLMAVICPTNTGRYCWRLITARGNHSTAATGGTAYLTRQAAIAGLRRFLKMYIRPEVVIEMP